MEVDLGTWSQGWDYLHLRHAGERWIPEQQNGYQEEGVFLPHSLSNKFSLVPITVNYTTRATHHCVPTWAVFSVNLLKSSFLILAKF